MVEHPMPLLSSSERTHVCDALRRLGVDVREDVSLKRMTTFGIGGPAEIFVVASTEDQVQAVLQTAANIEVPIFILGGGSNLLIADEGVHGIVLRLGGALAEVTVSDDGKIIRVGAGAKFPRLTRAALDCGWESAKGWIGTPGTVGGALKMNAGTRDGEIGATVKEVTLVGSEGIRRLQHQECGFGYRTSHFPTHAVLTRTDLQCDDRRIEKSSISALDLEAKMLLKKRHASQPKQRSAGSIFKNPPGDFAGRLIEEAGLKGMRIGDAQISEVHANFVVNHGGASARDVLTLARAAQDQVARDFGVHLQWEVRRVGAFPMKFDSILPEESK